MRPVFACLLAVLTVGTPAVAQDRQIIGEGRLLTNDFFGDGEDRWQTGSYVLSQIHSRGPFTGDEAFGDLLEYRIRAGVIAPDGRSAAPGDRPYVGMMALGAFTHFDVQGAEISAGAEVMAIGPQTGLSAFQTKFHEQFEMPAPQHTQFELANAFFLNGSLAAKRSYRLADTVSLHSFVEGQTGVEDLVRAGADLIVGPIAQDDLLLRDVVTGQLYQGTETQDKGVSYTVGIDIASVFDSDFLPATLGYAVSDTRTRARAGVYWQLGRKASFFYGATYLSPEFEGQAEGQVVGSVKLNFNF